MSRKYEWSHPYHYGEYLDYLGEKAKAPEFQLVRSLDVGRGSYCGPHDAWIVKDVANGIVCLQSYSTIVSVKSGICTEELGKWSRTTSHHQRVFAETII